MTVVLDIAGARKSYGDVPALTGASIQLHAGERLALLGPNGAGKSTLVRAVAGRTPLDAGTITLHGTTLRAGRHDGRAALGVIPQEIALYPTLTARENLEVFGAVHGVARAALADRARWAMEWTGLAERADDRAGTFSGGMKRRLNIACGILHEPTVILLDEPTVGVDPQSRERIWQMLEQLRDDGAALILTTHQLDEAQQVTDRIVIIDHGATIAAGTFDELLRATIGTSHLVSIALEHDAPPALAAHGFELDGTRCRRAVDDLARDLPQLIQQVNGAGVTIADVHVQAPSLQAVFIHLTGRELRE